MLGPELAKSLLPSIECCSDSEEHSDGHYESTSLPWRSQVYTQFLHNLDDNTINCLAEIKGKKKARSSVEYHCNYNSKAPENESYPCENLPFNCYSEKYLKSLNWTEKLVLDMKEDEKKLEDIVQNLTTTRCCLD